MIRRGLRKLGRGVRRVFRKRPARRQKANANNGLVHVKKTVLEPKGFVLGNSTTFGSDSFELADIPQYGDYGNLYEEFCITKIVYKFKALNNNALANVSGGAVSTLGMIHTIIDTNNSAPMTSIQSMMNDSSYKGTLSSRSHTRVFKPMWLNDVGAGGTQSKTGWLNTSNNNISHYGIKWAYEGGVVSGTATSFYVEPIVTYYLSFRNPK